MNKNAPGILGKWSIKITIASFLIFAGGLIISLFFYYPAYREEIKFVSITLAGLATIYSAYYIGIGLRLNLGLNKVTHSFQLLERCHATELIRYRVKIQQLLDANELPSKDITEKIKADPEMQISVKTTLNIFEDLAIAIQHGYADEAILYDDLSVYLPWFLKNMDPFINSLRSQYQDDRIYCESMKLAGSWAAGYYLSNGKKT